MNLAELPHDYDERVYAGVLGKTIGVYLGRPFEGWARERILAELGPIRGYVNERLGVPLVSADDDLTGTFTFFRALEAAGVAIPEPADVAAAWLNYTVPGRTIFWWGGMGVSTEHTAYLRLAGGVPAPESGSIERNGRVVAEQIGAQIFIDAWPMCYPGQPELAVRAARAAARVSHDGEAVHAACLIAAFESEAFVCRDLDELVETALGHVPNDCLISRMVRQIRERAAREVDWNDAFSWLRGEYGYDKFGGGCHVVPNHGVVMLAMLFGRGDLGLSLEIANTCGWDTDCNSGNVGCMVALMKGLAAFDGPVDWRTPVADRLLLPTADAGGVVSDCVAVAERIARVARRLRGQSLPPRARFHFAFSGSTRGFRGAVENASLEGRGERSLRLDFQAGRTRFTTSTFFQPGDEIGYQVMGSPTLSPGQRVRALVAKPSAPARVALCFQAGGEDHALPARDLGAETLLEAIVPDFRAPIEAVGVVIEADEAGSAHLVWLDWSGTPSFELSPKWPNASSVWAHSLSSLSAGERFELVQNEGLGFAIHGCREWERTAAEVELRPHMATSFGLAIGVQGLRRYLAVEFVGRDRARLVESYDARRILAESEFLWEFGEAKLVRLQLRDGFLEAFVDGKLLLREKPSAKLGSGAIGLLLEEGRLFAGGVRIEPPKEPRASASEG